MFEPHNISAFPHSICSAVMRVMLLAAASVFLNSLAWTLPVPDGDGNEQAKNLTSNWGQMLDPGLIATGHGYSIWLSRYTTPSLSLHDAVGGLSYCATTLKMEASYLPHGMSSPYPKEKYWCIDWTKRNSFEMRKYDEAGWPMTYQALWDLLILLIKILPLFGAGTPTFKISISNEGGEVFLFAQGGWYPSISSDGSSIA